MSVAKNLQDFKRLFDEKLFVFLDKKEKEGEKIDPSYSILIKEIRRMVRAGGKRLRPAFVFYGYKASGGKNFKNIWPLCLAVELIHIFALIHDDIMDASELRRGKPTTWKILGKNQAILIGDLAFALAEEIFKDCPCSPARTVLIQSYWQKLKEEVIIGQFLDISKSHVAMKQFSHEAIFKLMDLKSGRYTIARPLQIGAAAAGADESVLEPLFKYGLNLGIAFQIQDDILGMFGEEKVIGKPADSDLKEEKRTLLIAKMLEEINRNSLKLIEINRTERKFKKIFGNKNLTKKDLKWVRELMVEYQVLDYCQHRAKQYIKKAKKALQEIKLEKESKKFLLGVAEYMIERKR